MIRVTVKDQIEGFGDDEVFLYDSPTVADKENNNIVMDYNGERAAFSPLTCGCIEVLTEFKHMFRVRAYRPALTRADEGRYYFTIVLSDDSGYPATTLVGVYVEVIFEDVPPNLNSNCTARISSLDRWGYATVEFNHDMQAIYN